MSSKAADEYYAFGLRVEKDLQTRNIKLRMNITRLGYGWKRISKLAGRTPTVRLSNVLDAERMLVLAVDLRPC
jgi:hypothetical protein